MPDRDKHYTHLEAASQKTFNDMIQDFGVVTVMNADVYSISDIEEAAQEKWDKLCVELTPYEISEGFQPENAICHLDTLKIANITVEGPSKTISGGRYANPLIKLFKSIILNNHSLINYYLNLIVNFFIRLLFIINFPIKYLF